MEARPGADGPSEVSERAPQPRPEAPARSPTEVAVEFLKAQEEALSAEPLPLSRRDQVLRYFTALRKSLERAADAPADGR